MHAIIQNSDDLIQGAKMVVYSERLRDWGNTEVTLVCEEGIPDNDDFVYKETIMVSFKGIAVPLLTMNGRVALPEQLGDKTIAIQVDDEGRLKTAVLE